MLYYFNKGKNTTEIPKKKMYYRKNAMMDPTCQKWFVKFVLESVVSQRVEYNFTAEGQQK